TKELAAKLADLAADLERQGYAQERVARFVMRCVFTMFAEDIGLLPDEPFRQVLDKVAVADPKEFLPLAGELWHAMDEGKRFLLRKLLRFNGHVFRDAEALPLTREALALLLDAARADWQHVEPSIFGTLLVRALDPEERHRLGAEFTPRAYVERVVRPAVEEPIRERWTAVQAEVLQLRESGKPKDGERAEQRLREFHEWLRGLRFLDPACGSGNFLYVTMHLVKRIELEVIRALEEVTGSHEIRFEEVGPAQFHGIEIKAWAREIAELTLWIGYHQFWREHHDVQPPEPILRDTGTLECRDAVLAWDRIGEDPSRARPDPSPRIRHPVTGALVPDPEAIRHYFTYENARQAEWPRADFIVGNPPYVGEKRQRDVFGDGYVDALRSAYPELTDSADYVMYWWQRAACEVASGRAGRAGLITTNSITQSKNRAVIEDAAASGARVVWAVADHPWTDEVNGAAVRVAMTVLARQPASATLLIVDENGDIKGEQRTLRLNADLSASADVSSAAQTTLLGNAGMSAQGLKLVGEGFVLPAEETDRLLAADPTLREVVRPYRNGRDLCGRPRGVFVIDFAMRTEDEARSYPVAFDIVRARVKPLRDANKRAVRAKYWWRFGEPNPNLRSILSGLRRFLVTLEVGKHRFFQFMAPDVAPDGTLVCIASD
ncbi:MAG: DNA methyltransferase, partial [Gemmatimonadota bacterium]